MTKQAKSQVIGQGELGQGLTSVKLIGKARSEKNAQLKLNAMVLAIAKKQVGLSKIADAALAELKRAKAVLIELKDRKLTTVSDFSVLRRLYDESLSKITLKQLQEEQVREAEKFCKRFFGGKEQLNEDQQTIISRYHAIKAEESWAVIEQINLFLSFVSPKETKKEVKATVPQEGEAAMVNE